MTRPAARLLAAAVGALLASARVQGDALVSLEDALVAARAANARLPIAALDLTIAREKASEARAERWLKVAVEGDFIYAPPNGYDPAITNAGEERLQVVGRQTLYDGGSRRAAVARADADVETASARHRIAEKDLELEVRSRYYELLQSAAEVEARRAGIERLEAYRTSLESRKAAGLGVGADLLKIDVRLAAEKASIVDAEGRRDSARLSLNDSMGRDPEAALAVVSLSEPAVAPATATPVDSLPEIEEAVSQEKGAAADVEAARAEKKPHLSLSADVGFLGSDTSRLVPADLLTRDPHANFGDRFRRDAGYSAGLFLSWPVWDLGAIRSRIREAELRLESARRNIDLQRREVRRQRAQAQSTMQSLSEQIRILSQAAPTARDSYLDAQSRYRGGATTALEVLDAYSSAVDGQVRLSEAVLRYRIAQAVALRWSLP